MNKIVKICAKKSFSGDDILKLVDNKANLMTYSDVAKCNNIEEVLGKNGACIILYETKENYGHWTCIFKVNKNTIEFFDPYGCVLDDELKYISDNFKQKSGTDFPHLTEMLYNSKYKVIYNDYPLQKYKNDINTCGRHVGFRLQMRKIPLEKYAKVMLKSGFNMSPDDLVTILTMFI